MSTQIQVIGFRNALFVGEVKQTKSQPQQPEGIGLLFDDMAVTCLSSWSTDKKDSTIRPTGSTVILYPHRQILYTDQYPTGNQFKGFWCCIVPQLRVFGHGQNQSFAILHSNGNVISKARFRDGQLKYDQQITYENQQQKWKRIEQIIRYKVPPEKRSLRKFIESNFADKLNNNNPQLNFINFRPKSNEYLYGIITNNEGLAFCLKQTKSDLYVETTGHYSNFQPKKSLSFGRKYLDQINSTSYKVYQGNFQTNELYKFEFTDKRPSQSYKISRKYFRQATNYNNKYIQLSEADGMYKRLYNLTKEYMIKVGTKYGQKIIEGSQQKFTSRTYVQPREQREEPSYNTNELYRTNKYDEGIAQPFINRQYNLNEAKAIIQSEISKRKLNSDRTRKGLFPVSSPRKHIDENPISSYQNSQRYQSKSPNKLVNKTKRYDYTDGQQIEETEYKYERIEPRTQRYKVNQFTLYPAHEPLERQRKDYYMLEKEIERQIKMQNTENERIMRTLERQKAKDNELRMRISKQIEKQNQLQSLLEQQKKLLLNKIGSFGPKQHTYEPVVMKEHNSPTRMSTGLGNQYISSNNIKHKYFQNYNYTEETEERAKQASFSKYNQPATPMAHRQITPVNLLLNENIESAYRPVSRSPIGNKKPTARRLYTYMD